MTSPVIERIFAEAIHAAIPDATLTGSEWANTYRYVSQGPHRGEKWDMAMVPYLIEPLNCITDRRVREIVFWSASRVAKTEGLLLNATGYFMHKDPRPIMHLRPTLDDAKLFSRERFNAMIDETPVLRGLIEDPRTRDSDNTMLYKKFLGGNVFFTGANATTGLRAQDFSVLCADEIDDMPISVGNQGDPLWLADVRLRQYAKVGEALSILTSSPTIKNDSRIEKAYASTDQRRLFVPCLACGLMQELVWSSIVWTELGLEAKDACFRCVGCGHIGPEEEKAEMIANWEWRGHAPFNGRVGFKLLGTYSPWIRWGDMAVELVNAKRARSYEMYQVWCNSTLGELWEVGEGIEEDEFAFVREDYRGHQVPAGVAFITFGADVHPDRIEVEIVGWGLDDENWGIDYKVFFGDPSQYPSPVWTEFEEYLETEWKHELGITLTAKAGAIDTGNCTDETYSFLHANRNKRWYGIKGASVAGRPIVPRRPSRLGKHRVRVWVIGTEAAKDKTAAMFRVTKEGPRFCHIPEIECYDDEWFKQISSEKCIRTVNKKNFSVWAWVKKKPGARNEAWDCRNYAVAAKEILNPNTPKERQRVLDEAEQVKPKAEADQTDTAHVDSKNENGGVRQLSQRAMRQPSSRRRGGFAKNW